MDLFRASIIKLSALNPGPGLRLPAAFNVKNLNLDKVLNPDTR